MAKKRNKRLKILKKKEKTLPLLFLILACITIGVLFLRINFKDKESGVYMPKLIEQTSPTTQKPLSTPAKLTEEFYKSYVKCWNETIGKKSYSEWNCESLISTTYFTQNMINSMSGRTKAYCGYEPPTEVYVKDKLLDSNSATVDLWSTNYPNNPTAVHLTKNNAGNWQITQIDCNQY